MIRRRAAPVLWIPWDKQRDTLATVMISRCCVIWLFQFETTDHRHLWEVGPRLVSDWYTFGSGVSAHMRYANVPRSSPNARFVFIHNNTKWGTYER